MRSNLDRLAVWAIVLLAIVGGVGTGTAMVAEGDKPDICSSWATTSACGTSAPIAVA